jgi:hypothetical protein
VKPRRRAITEGGGRLYPSVDVRAKLVENA